MLHETTLITTIVAGLVLAFVFGTIANRLRLPPLVGYLFAGILVGPHTPGFIADQGLASQLAELGVILLMFGVGLHFSLKDLMSVRALAIPGAVVQIGLATLLGLGLALFLGWNAPQGLVFGLALSVASTVVLLKALQERRLVETERGRIAVGWLIVEDLAMVLALVLIPAFAGLGGADGVELHDPFVTFFERIFGGEIGVVGVVGLTLVKIAAFVGFMMIVGRRAIPWSLHAVAHTGNRELFRLAVLAIALGVALGSAYLFGVSLALGAFFAGMILSESELSHRAAQETLPLRDAFAVLFFVSVGMLFDPTILLRDPLPVLATVLIIVVGKSVAAFLIVIAFRHSVGTALVIAASLAQIGEFSFILAELGLQLNLLPPEGRDLILAGAILSIVLNPLVFWGADRLRPQLEAWIQGRRAVRHGHIEPSLAADGEALGTAGTGEDEDETDEEPHPTTLSAHTVVVGFGRVGRVVAGGLRQAHSPHLVIEDADSRIASAREAGSEVVVGNAARGDVLRRANISGAVSLVVAIPNSFEAGQVTEQARKLNPGIRIIARAHGDDEEEHLTHLGADTVILGEREIALGMLAWLETSETAPAVAPEAGSQEIAPLSDVTSQRLVPAENLLLREAPETLVLPTPRPVQPLEPEQPLAAGPLTEPTLGDDVVESNDLELAANEDQLVFDTEPSSENRTEVILPAVEPHIDRIVVVEPVPNVPVQELEPAESMRAVTDDPAFEEDRLIRHSAGGALPYARLDTDEPEPEPDIEVDLAAAAVPERTPIAISTREEPSARDLPVAPESTEAVGPNIMPSLEPASASAPEENAPASELTHPLQEQADIAAAPFEEIPHERLQQDDGDVPPVQPEPRG